MLNEISSQSPYITGGPHRPNRLLLLGFIIMSGIVVWLAFKSCDKPLPPKPDTVPVSVIKDSVKAATDRANKTIDSLNATVRKYRTVADSGKAALAKIMERVKEIGLQNDQKLFRKLGKKYSGNSLSISCEPKIIGATPNDYAGGDLQAIIKEQTELLHQQDSACRLTVSALEDMVVNREAVIVAKDTLLAAVNRQLSLALTNQTTLENYSKQLRKAAKRARAGRGFWRTAAVVLGGVVAWLSLK